MRKLNRTEAWQLLQASDFGEPGHRRLPDVEKLAACLQAARRLGLVADNHDGELQFLATVHDCTHNTVKPVRLLVWRVAQGVLYRAKDDSIAWAKAQIKARDGPPPERGSGPATFDEIRRQMRERGELP